MFKENKAKSAHAEPTNKVIWQGSTINVIPWQATLLQKKEIAHDNHW